MIDIKNTEQRNIKLLQGAEISQIQFQLLRSFTIMMSIKGNKKGKKCE